MDIDQFCPTRNPEINFSLPTNVPRGRSPETIKTKNISSLIFAITSVPALMLPFVLFTQNPSKAPSDAIQLLFSSFFASAFLVGTSYSISTAKEEETVLDQYDSSETIKSTNINSLISAIASVPALMLPFVLLTQNPSKAPSDAIQLLFSSFFASVFLVGTSYSISTAEETGDNI